MGTDFLDRDFAPEMYLVDLAARLQAGTATPEEVLEAANMLSQGVGARLGLEADKARLERALAVSQERESARLRSVDIADLDVDPDAKINYLLVEVHVSYLPRDNPNYRYFALKVRRRRDDWFGIHSEPYLYNRNGDWDLDRPSPDFTEDELRQWHDNHFFDYQEALQRAALLAPDVEVNGLTARDAAAVTTDRLLR